MITLVHIVISYIESVYAFILLCVNTIVSSLMTSSVIEKTKRRLKSRYKALFNPNADDPHHYIQLAIIRQSKVNRNDKHLNDITKLTIQGLVDDILEVKEQLDGIKDIFHYKDTECPRIILILGAPGRLHNIATLY